MSPPPTGTTRVAAVIGDPVRHSRSPAIFNAAFAASGLDWIYVALPVGSGDGARAVEAMRVLGIAGLSVTMPHKADVATACDVLTADAAILGAVNSVLRRDDGTILGASTDGEGLIRSLAAEGFDPAGAEVVVLGAGGAARALVLALGRAGARVTVAARRPEAARSAAELADGRASSFDALDLAGARLVVNATPIGMAGEAPLIDVDTLAPTTLVVDTVYHPTETPLLTLARARGLAAVNGLGMLVHQAACSFELWTGQPAPLDVMSEAARG